MKTICSVYVDGIILCITQNKNNCLDTFGKYVKYIENIGFKLLLESTWATEGYLLFYNKEEMKSSIVSYKITEEQ